MLRAIRFFPLFLFLICFTACSARVGYRVYDPGYNDYHYWDSAEFGYYNTWLGETHRHYRDYRKLSRRDQDDYWRWRHERHEHHN